MITHQIALRAAWTVFISVLVIGLLMIIVLLLGAANPPRAGSLQWQTENFVYTVRQLENYSFPQQIDLPRPPYTLEIGGTFSIDSDPMADWGITLTTDSDKLLGAYLNGYQFYSVLPTQPDFTPFIHLRKNGVMNKLTVHVEADRQITLRINDEIAWHGLISDATQARIDLHGGLEHSAELTINFVDVYYPTD